MVNLVNLLATEPTGFWASIITFFSNTFVNYALAILMLTICIKLIMLPFDFLNKRTTRKQQQVQSKIQPELDALQKKYANNKEMLNQKQQELYKKQGLNMGTSCLIMLVNMVITLVVFITLFNGLNAMASYKLQNQYETLEQTYISVEYSGNYADLTTEQIDSIVASINADETKKATANALVEEKYKEVKESFLWINNVWMADSPLQKQIPNFDSYIKTTRTTFEDIKNEDGTIKVSATTLKENAKLRYETIMNPLIDSNSGVNGYFILTVLTVGISFIMQFGSQKYWFRKKSIRAQYKEQQEILKRKIELGQATKPASSMNMMMIMMPILMGYFTLSYNSIFSLYIVVGQLFGFVTTPLIDYILDIKEEKMVKEANLDNKGRIVKQKGNKKK